MTELTPAHVEYIAKYSGLREQFINLFKASFNTENGKFLMAVADYKTNPRWDSCMSIYHLFIRETGGGLVGKPGDKIKVIASERVNLPAAVRLDIEAKMKTRKGQVGGLGDPHIYDAAFMVVLRTTAVQKPLDAQISAFIESHHINAATHSEYSRFAGIDQVQAILQ